MISLSKIEKGISIGKIIAAVVFMAPLWLFGIGLEIGAIGSMIESMPRKNEEIIDATVSKTECAIEEIGLNEVYVSFRYQGYTYEDMYLDSILHNFYIDDTIPIAVSVIESADEKPQLEIRNPRRTESDKESLRNSLITGLTLIGIGFAPMIICLASYWDKRRRNTEAVYTGVVKSCSFDHTNSNGDDIYCYEIVYSIGGKYYLVSEYGAYGELPLGKIVRVYAVPSAPADGMVNLSEVIPEKECRSRAGKARRLYEADITGDRMPIDGRGIFGCGLFIVACVATLIALFRKTGENIFSIHNSHRPAYILLFIFILIGLYFLFRTLFGQKIQNTKYQAYTGVVKRCSETNFTINDRFVYRYIIAYMVDGTIYWKNIESRYGEINEGQVIRVRAKPENPKKCIINFDELMLTDEYKSRSAEANELLAAEIPFHEQKKDQSQMSALAFFSVFIVVGLLTMVLGLLSPDFSLGDRIGYCIVGLALLAGGVFGIITTLKKRKQ